MDNVTKWLEKAANAELDAMNITDPKERGQKLRMASVAFKKAMAEDGTPMTLAESQEFSASLG